MMPTIFPSGPDGWTTFWTAAVSVRLLSSMTVTVIRRRPGDAIAVTIRTTDKMGSGKRCFFRPQGARRKRVSVMVRICGTPPELEERMYEPRIPWFRPRHRCSNVIMVPAAGCLPCLISVSRMRPKPSARKVGPPSAKRFLEANDPDIKRRPSWQGTLIPFPKLRLAQKWRISWRAVTTAIRRAVGEASHISGGQRPSSDQSLASRCGIRPRPGGHLGGRLDIAITSAALLAEFWRYPFVLPEDEVASSPGRGLDAPR